MSSKKRIWWLVISAILGGRILYAQMPQNYPDTTTEPLELTLFNVLFYIILPILIVIAFFVIRRRVRRK